METRLGTGINAKKSMMLLWFIYNWVDILDLQALQDAVFCCFCLFFVIKLMLINQHL